ncbi:putative 60S ribosomal protein L6-like [Capsicum annuum]|uniref:HECT-type E3 ubiquitin transferase n=1 Tax=Capsicum annuum TaxID=4072 RepID=A0A1U8EJI2_CAPAN|nr:E3 ubiquitin-protein ligase UPL5-like [Capsicum annuum]KAF3646233.1 putative 60S ribosomal protein L6-like [Capsicum annuum]KAF3665605.1 putative 60S ribosomal protein L6-like [Capsicum annuum]PHT71071.1 hypothetical protein T459_26175 [Capsicum annuum]
MQIHQTAAPVSSSFNVKSSNHQIIQIFVRLFCGKTLAIQVYPTDTVEVIHDKLLLITGIPISDQRLIYGGKQLQLDQTVSHYGIEKASELQLVGRLRSTMYPQTWKLMNDLYSLIFDFCKPEHGLFQSDVDHIMSVFSEFLSRTPGDFDLASEYLEIFIYSSVPKALVKLYTSRKIVADKCIYEIIGSYMTKSVTSIHSRYSIYITVLKFCKILGKEVEFEDNLYIFCRSSLGTIIQRLGIASCKADTKELASLQDVFPFVYQIAAQLYVELESIMKSTDSSLSVSLVDHFTAFMLPVRTVIQLQVLFDVPITFPLMKDETGEAQYYRESIEWLHKFFYGLLEKIVLSLKILEGRWGLKEGGEDRQAVQTWWSLYLKILKELNSISKLYTGLENVFWQKTREVKVSLSFLIVKFATKSEDHGWLIEHKEVTNFKARRQLSMMMLPQVGYNKMFHMLIDRSRLLEESFKYIGNASPVNLRGKLFMEFKHEVATGPGVLKEWFLLVGQAIFNPQNALFVACPNHPRRFFPNLASKVNPLHLKYFCFSGRMIALALMRKVQIGVVFDRTFFLQLAGKNISLEDVRDTDPYLYNSCKLILDMDPEMVDQDNLGLRFFCEVDQSLGSRKGIELCPNGKDTVVDSKNRETYVNLLIEHHFVTSIAEQVASFVKGFDDITTTSSRLSFFQYLNPEDLDLMLDGYGNDISVEDWKAHTNYHGYKRSDCQISWFWKIVESMSVEQRKVLLFFWTSIKSLPLNGFGGLDSKLYICKNSKPYDHLPSSQTCFYSMYFPPYKSKSIMQDRLRIITQEHVGCSFGAS